MFHKNKYINRLLSGFLLLFVLVLQGCGNTADSAAGVNGQPIPRNTGVTLTVSAAASLKDSMEEIASLYEKEHENIELTMNFGASGSLQKQIEQGAPADLFISAGQKQMNALIEGKFVDEESKVDLLRNKLVLIVPSDADVVPGTLDDLSQSGLGKIALGEPEVVPAGFYTKETLEYERLWETLQPKMVFAKDVTQVLTYVESGNADAGFVYESDAKLSSKVKTAFAIDETSHAPIIYPAGIVAATKYSDDAKEFLAFLQTPAARDVFLKHGFTASE